MPYDQTTPYQGAQFISQGLNQASQSIGEGLQQYAKNKQADALASGQIEAYLKQAAAGGVPLSDGTQKLAERFTSGKAGLNDKMSLLGSLQTDAALKTQSQQQQLQAQQLAQGQQQQQMQAIALQNAQRQQSALSRLSQMGQLANGVGGGVLQPGVQDGQRAALQDPTTNMMARYANATGALPPAALISQYVTRQQNVEKPAGVVYVGPTVNPETQQPQFDNYLPILKKNDGGIRYGEKQQVPYGSPAPAPVLDSATFQPVTKGAPSGYGGDPKKLASNLPKIITGPQAKALEGANADYQNAWANLTSAQNMMKAVQTYAANNPHGDRDNPIMGGDHGLKVRAVLGDKSGYDLLAAGAKLTAAQFNDMKTGSGRLSQNEFNAIMKNIPQPENPNSTNLENATQMLNMFKYRLDLAKARKDLLATGLNEGEASAKANERVPYPFGGNSVSAPAAPSAPMAADPNAAARAWAQSNPNDPRAAVILKHLGTQ